jgi:hypothetical protein
MAPGLQTTSFFAVDLVKAAGKHHEGKNLYEGFCITAEIIAVLKNQS